jgi:hypothetical protein
MDERGKQAVKDLVNKVGDHLMEMEISRSEALDIIGSVFLTLLIWTVNGNKEATKEMLKQLIENVDTAERINAE